ncbi:MAG: hypothetical protein LBC98_07375 [Prevotellaceae bacterium]|jgi:Leucine-rich repeat (LRR) protein|nr:hypothetical protein [Prevotellaceae bacterium]
MKTSKLLTVALCGLLALASCKKDEEPSNQLTLTPESLNFTSAESTQAISVNTDREWTATPNSTWVSLDTTSGSGSGTINVTVKPNISVEPRTTSVTVKSVGSNLTRSVSITQEGSQQAISVENKRRSIGSYQQAIEVHLSANVPYLVNVIEAGWVQPEAGAGAQTTPMQFFNINANNTSSSRTARVVFSMAGNSDISDTLYLTQLTEVMTGRLKDSLALVTIFELTGGNNWTDNAGWLEAPLEEWSGVSLENNRVITLDLQGKSLSGTIPPEIGHLDELTALYLAGNSLTGNIPDNLMYLSKLVIMYLNDNQLSGSIPSNLFAMDSLQIVHLEGNQLTGAIPDHYATPSRLQEIYLSYNNLTGSIPAELGDLQELSTIEIIGNSLSGSIPSELGNAPKLFLLDLSENNLTGSIPGALGLAPELTIFVLAGNQLSGAVPQSVLDKVNEADVYTFIICPQQGAGFNNYTCPAE